MARLDSPTRVPIFLSSIDMAMNPQLNAIALPHLERKRLAYSPPVGELRSTSFSMEEEEEQEFYRREATMRWLIFLAFFCLAAIITFSVLNHFYGYTSVPQFAQQKPAKRFQRGLPELTFTIKVFGWNRRASLKRLCQSLKRADYGNHQVKLQFFIDGGGPKEVVEYVKSFEWPHGPLEQQFRERRFGLRHNIINSWKAESDSEYAFFFEDDIEVSPYYFQYTLQVLRKLRDLELVQSGFAGVALMTIRYDEISGRHKIWRPKQDGIITEAGVNAFFFQLPGSWGALYFPWVWRDFLAYYETRKQLPVSTELLPGVYVNKWKRSWKRFMVELFYYKGLFMMYPLLDGQYGYSMHHRLMGEHTGKGQEAADTDALQGKMLDYFRTHLVRNETQFRESLSHINGELPVISLHHDRVTSLACLRMLGTWLLEAWQKAGMPIKALIPTWNGCVADYILGVREAVQVYEPGSAVQKGAKVLVWLDPWGTEATCPAPLGTELAGRTLLTLPIRDRALLGQCMKA